MSNSTVIVTNVGVTHGVTIHLPAKQIVLLAVGATVLLLVVIWFLWPKRST